jgi:hypothetical protein
MKISLSSENVIQYLYDTGLFTSQDSPSPESDLHQTTIDKHIFLVKLSGNRQIIIKQETPDEEYPSNYQSWNEWVFHQLLLQFPLLSNIPAIASLLLHFDAENSILVCTFLSEYIELEEFYKKHSIFPLEIATSIGSALACLHSYTFQKREYRDFIDTAPEGELRYNYYNPVQGISSLTQQVLGKIPTAALAFHALYQQYEELESVIADLSYHWKPCCLTHNDLQLDNILVHSRWQNLDDCLVRFKQWGVYAWGDPAFDLGTLLASYLQIWLSSLVVDSSLDLEESLDLALISLDMVQPSLIAIMRTYFQVFPTVLEYFPQFIIRVVQFTGLALIHYIQKCINYYKYFDKTHLSMLEVGKKLLTMPENSLLNIFGTSPQEILPSVIGVKIGVKTYTKKNGRETNRQIAPIYYPKTRLRGC